MLWSLVKVMLLSLVLETIVEDGNQCLGNLRAIDRQSSLFRSYKSFFEREKRLQTKKPSYVTTTPDIVTTPHTDPPTTPKVMTEFMEQVELCRGNYPKMSNQTFYLILYENLNRGNLNGRPPAIACNVSTDMISKIKLPLFDIFSSVLKSRNDSLLKPGPSSSDSRPTADGSRFHWDAEPSDAQDNLELNLGPNWMESMPRVPHLSHIYIGHALYPFITEESRVLDKVHTFAPPRFTQPSVARNKEKREAKIRIDLLRHKTTSSTTTSTTTTTTTTATTATTADPSESKKSFRRRFFNLEIPRGDSFPDRFNFRKWGTEGRREY